MFEEQDKERQAYVLMELLGESPRFPGASDSWLTTWEGYHHYLDSLLENEEMNMSSATVRFTIKMLNDDEFVDYLTVNEIEWRD